MLINDVGSRNVYENKQKDDNLPKEKGGISAQWNDISYGSTHILLKASGFLSLFEPWGTNPAPQNIETRGKGEAFPHSKRQSRRSAAGCRTVIRPSLRRGRRYKIQSIHFRLHSAVATSAEVR
jgi:hypothetical protein